MAKNLIFLSDGTANDRAVDGATNVYKLHQRLHSDITEHNDLDAAAVRDHLNAHEVEQITFYDPGIGAGTGVFTPVRKATGKGITNNIKDGYDFLLRFYKPGDRIYLFGFSRGAYTVRSLAGLIGLCGIPIGKGDTEQLLDKNGPGNLVDAAYKIYSTQPGPKGAELRKRLGNAFIANYCPPEHSDPAKRAAYMIGVWDTVRALGIPVRFTNLEVPFYRHRFHDHDLSEHVRYAFHALSIDDERRAYHPVIWNEPTAAQQAARELGGLGGTGGQVFSQVWFPGVHGDVGGGYTDDTMLSDGTLSWMIKKISGASHPPKFKGGYADDPMFELVTSPDGDIHDSRKSLGKKLLYVPGNRTVARGAQAPDSTKIVPDKDQPVAQLHKSWVERHENDGISPRYDPEPTVNHPDAVTARVQTKERTRPLPGPFRYIDD